MENTPTSTAPDAEWRPLASDFRFNTLFNRPEGLEQTIRSVILQGYPNLQYILVDGLLTIETQTLLERYSQDVDLCLNERSVSRADAINIGFQHSDGEVLTWLDSGDIYLPDTLVRIASVGKKAEIIHGPVLRYCDKDNNPTIPQLPLDLAALPFDEEGFTSVQFPPKPLEEPIVFFTRKVWVSVGSALNSSLLVAENHDLWLRMAKIKPESFSIGNALAVRTAFPAPKLDPEHQAVTAFHYAHPEPQASYVPEAKRDRETDLFAIAPLSRHQTMLGNCYVPRLAENDGIGRSMRLGRMFEPLVIDAVRPYIIPGTIVLDIGSNFGQMSILFSELIGRRGMVFSFEAQEHCYQILLKNITANKRNNIRPFHAAVADRRTLPTGKSVNTLAIDDLNLTRPISFIKIDTQGRDLLVLKGAKETLLKHRTPVMFGFNKEIQEGFSFEDYVTFVHSISYSFVTVVDRNNYIIAPKRVS